MPDLGLGESGRPASVSALHARPGPSYAGADRCEQHHPDTVLVKSIEVMLDVD